VHFPSQAYAPEHHTATAPTSTLCKAAFWDATGVLKQVLDYSTGAKHARRACPWPLGHNDMRHPLHTACHLSLWHALAGTLAHCPSAHINLR